jgi:hypothetical protein
MDDPQPPTDPIAVIRARLRKLERDRPPGLCEDGCYGRCRVCPSERANELLALIQDLLAALAADRLLRPVEHEEKDDTRHDRQSLPSAAGSSRPQPKGSQR